MSDQINGWLVIIAATAITVAAMADVAAYAYQRFQPDAKPAAASGPIPGSVDYTLNPPANADPNERQYLAVLARQVMFQERDAAAYYTRGDAAALDRRPCRTLSIACDERYPVPERIEMLRRLQAALTREPSASDQIAADMAFR